MFCLQSMKSMLTVYMILNQEKAVDWRFMAKFLMRRNRILTLGNALKIGW
ncbi:hypothetical protein MTBLM5_10261 [Magnetospirillum sp. LM-5]|nr:hypothetical protein MTBLM5_10261 [Magnetospirillum sp. LM-5]